MSTAESSKKKRMTQAERSAQSDRQMFEEAIKLIIERGPNKTTLTDIGIMAGYSRGLATYRYGTKDNFFSALIHHLNHLWREELDKSIKDTRGITTVKEAITALQNFLHSHPDHLRAMHILYYDSIDHHSEMTQKLAEIHSAQRKQATQWMEEEIADSNATPSLSLENFADFLRPA